MESLKVKVEETEMCKATINDSKETALKEVNEAVNKAYTKHIGSDEFNTSIRSICEMRLREAIQNDKGLLNPALNSYLNTSTKLKETVLKCMRKCLDKGHFHQPIM